MDIVQKLREYATSQQVREGIEEQRTDDGDTQYLKLHNDIAVYHKALNNVLALFVIDAGTDYNCVNDAIAAMRRHPELGIRLSLAMRIPELQDDLVESVVDAVEETGLIDDRAKAGQRVKAAIEERNKRDTVTLSRELYDYYEKLEEATWIAYEFLQYQQHAAQNPGTVESLSAWTANGITEKLRTVLTIPRKRAEERVPTDKLAEIQENMGITGDERVYDGP